LSVSPATASGLGLTISEQPFPFDAGWREENGGRNIGQLSRIDQ
jgi:hypothetical protein